MDHARIDYVPRRRGREAMLRLTIPRGQDIAFIFLPFSALKMVDPRVILDNEASMRATFHEQVFNLNSRLTKRVARLTAGQVLLVTAAMLWKAR